MRSRSIGGVQRKRKESTPLNRADHVNAVTSLTARRPPLPATTTAMAKTKTERKEVTFGSESRDETQQQRSLNAPPPPPERKSGREEQQQQQEIDSEDDAKKVATRKVRGNVPSANSGTRSRICRLLTSEIFVFIATILNFSIPTSDFV